MARIELLAPVQLNYNGYIVPGLITHVYDEQPNDADEAVDIHAFVPAELNVPGNLAYVPGCRHAENQANPKAKRFVFLGEDLKMLDPANDLKQGEDAPPEDDLSLPVMDEAERRFDPADTNQDGTVSNKERKVAAAEAAE